MLGTTLMMSPAAGAAVGNIEGRCGSTFQQLVFQGLPETKRLIIRRGTLENSKWVTTIDGTNTSWTKPAPGINQEWIVKVVPTNGSRYTLTCLDAAFPITELGYTGPGCALDRIEDNILARTQLLFYGMSGTRAQLRSVESGWIAGVEDAFKATIRDGFVTISPIENKENAKYKASDTFFVRIRQGGEVVDIACVAPLARDKDLFLRSPDIAPPIPADVAVDHPNVFVRTDGEQVVEIVDKATGMFTTVEISDDYVNPRISPDGRVLWLLDREEQEELRIDLDSRLVNRRPRER